MFIGLIFYEIKLIFPINQTEIKQNMAQQYSFSGHESFYCKQFWLKKGFDFVKSERKFSDPNAVVDLGVGKNMVSSINFWVKAFDIVDSNDVTTEIAEFLLGDNGVDPFIEDIGTVWLLHYLLVNKKKASIYNLVFNKLRLERYEFQKEQLHSFIKRECDKAEIAYNKNTVEKDIKVFLKNYVKPEGDKINVEEDYVGLLMDLNLVQHYQKINEHNRRVLWYSIESEQRSSLPIEVVLFTILDNQSYGNTISFRELLTEPDSPGLVFCLNPEGLYNKLTEIAKKYRGITFTETAGNQVFQLNGNIDKLDVLNDYYQK